MPRATGKPRGTARRRRTPRLAAAGVRTAGRRLARWLVAGGILVLVCAAIFAARRPLLVAAGHVLIDRDQLRPADAILLLAGDMESRPEEAARLYHHHLAPRVLVVREQDPPSVQMGIRPNTSVAAVAVMQHLGVPPTAITMLHFPGGTTSTFDEARAFREWAYMAHPRSVIVVTSLFHTRRAGWLIRGQLERLHVSVLMDPVRPWRYDEHNWWNSEDGLVDYLEEFPKILHEILRD